MCPATCVPQPQPPKVATGAGLGVGAPSRARSSEESRGPGTRVPRKQAVTGTQMSAGCPTIWLKNPRSGGTSSGWCHPHQPQRTRGEPSVTKGQVRNGINTRKSKQISGS
uniref:Uncharacterized protein n=1 Tax=Setaria viridis TaxID=4556 RepID=A0A4U6TKU8_SETVI|nr:hypothetical protein SEVIR_7G001600v2 [Setaria viridis]